jgi:hypothetical protein
MDTTYYGMASANGLESFILDETHGKSVLFNKILYGRDAQSVSDKMSSMISDMVMAARANPQRWSVVFRAKVSFEAVDEIKELLKGGDPVGALIHLKDRATEIALAQDVPGAKRMWEKIPNPEIDPFGSGF